jgi:hypothetical protein
MVLPYFLVNLPLKNLSNLLLYSANVGKFQPEIPIIDYHDSARAGIHR